MQNQEIDLRRTVEMVQNMTDEEKAAIVQTIPTWFLYDEMGKRFMEMERRIEDAGRALGGG